MNANQSVEIPPENEWALKADEEKLTNLLQRTTILGDLMQVIQLFSYKLFNKFTFCFQVIVAVVSQ